jgi:stage V sporulation protein AC
MELSPKTYRRYAQAHAPRSPIVRDCLRAFLIGGTICCIAQGLRTLYGDVLHFTGDDVGTMTSVTLILLTAILTGFGLFEKIARFAGAGTLVPITGFANAVVSSAIDSRAEGYVLGVGAKIFTVAGPVLLYGTVAGTLYGVIVWIVSLF